VVRKALISGALQMLRAPHGPIASGSAPRSTPPVNVAGPQKMLSHLGRERRSREQSMMSRCVIDEAIEGSNEAGTVSLEGTRYGKLNQDWCGYGVLGDPDDPLATRVTTVCDGHG